MRHWLRLASAQARRSLGNSPLALAVLQVESGLQYLMDDSWAAVLYRFNPGDAELGVLFACHPSPVLF